MEFDTNAHAPITVLIAVAVRLYRDGLSAALSAHERLRIQGTAGTPGEVQGAVRALQPDVVIVDVALGDVLDLMHALRAENSHSRILAFAVGDDIDSILEYAKAGAEGFFTSNGSLAELVEAIERTAAGELLCSPRVAAQLLKQATHAVDPPVPRSTGQLLTCRERQVFRLLKQGRSNKEIANALHIAEATVKNHVHHLLDKMHVGTRGQAVANAAWLEN
jgi:two-component system nitrate/nitrite response regulator NarL